jgi:phenylpropionate dioxygenase-like ring-hydroxylating dioxygenase large terminal subunit
MDDIGKIASAAGVGSAGPDKIAALVSDDGCYVGRKVFTDPAVYAAEKRSIFGKSWLYLAHDSQLPNVGDFVTTYMAETPVIVTRGTDGNIHALANSCSHRGLPVCRADFGNAKGFVCPYHAWTYGLSGELLAVPQERKVGQIDKSALGLPPVPRVESYRGFIFGSFGEGPGTLADHLGGMRFYIDVYLDRFPGGVEVIGPPHKWLLAANWKLPYENQLGDLGHGAYLHGALTGPGVFSEAETYGFGMVPEPGHSAAVRMMPETATDEERAWGIEGVSAGMAPQVHDYLMSVQQSAAARLGPVRSRIKGLVCGIYPNFNFVWSNHSIRVAHPRGPGRTELWSWWIVPRDAPDAVKQTLRQQYSFVLGPAGIVEQEDSEAWAQQWIGSNVDYLDDRPYFYGLGMGEEGSHPDMPGVAGRAFNEYYARAFYRRWRAELIAGDVA